ncbi:MAG: ABC transporter permease, partial [Acidobacteriota bacterium]
MGSILRDLRFAVRVLGRNPGFTLAAVLVMALGIGANTAVFSAVYAVLLKPLAYRDPARLVVALHDGRSPVSPADFLDYKAQATVFSELGAAQAWGGALTSGNQSEVVPGLQITPNILPLLGVQPKLGRAFSAAEADAGLDVVLLSDRLWRRQFASDPDIAGRSVLIGGKPYTVSGVMPADFRFAPFWQTEAEMWRPLDLAARLTDRGGRSLRVFGRLREGVSLEQARTQMSTIAARLAAAYPASNAGLGIAVVPLREKVVGPIRPTLLILLGTVGLVLVIACADIANLLLARAVGRRKEMATRMAMGASRFQLVRQLSLESVLLAAAGGALGVLFAHFGLDLLRANIPASGLPRDGEIALDRTVLFFASALSLIAGLVSGLIPALQASGINVNEHLKEGGRGASEGRTGRHAQSVLVTAQVSLALVLLVGAGLLVRSLQKLTSVDPGFDPSHVLTFEVAPQTRFDTPAKRDVLFRRIAAGLAATEGVESVGAVNHLPLAGDVWMYRYQVPGRPAPLPGHEYGAAYRVVRPGYFATLRMALVSGRGIEERDNETAPPVVVINQTMARHQWPNENPVGRQVVFLEGGGKPVPLTIVGVVRDVRQSEWTGPLDDEVYFPYAQRLSAFGSSSTTFVVRTREAPEILAAHFAGGAMREAMGIAPDVPVSRLRTMDQVISVTLWRSRVSTLLLSAFALIALLLAAAGIYSVISYSVRRRTQELGIRVALGASASSVLGMVLRESFGPVLAGLAIGIGGSVACVRFLETLLYQVPPADPLTFFLVVLCLVGTSAAATVIPALRALRSDPLAALRH